MSHIDPTLDSRQFLVECSISKTFESHIFDPKIVQTPFYIAGFIANMKVKPVPIKRNKILDAILNVLPDMVMDGVTEVQINTPTPYIIKMLRQPYANGPSCISIDLEQHSVSKGQVIGRRRVCLTYNVRPLF